MRPGIKLTREELIEKFQVDEQGVIRKEGKFHGQKLYVPYFMAVFSMKGEDAIDERGNLVIRVLPSERLDFPEIGTREVIRLTESGQEAL